MRVDIRHHKGYLLQVYSEDVKLIYFLRDRFTTTYKKEVRYRRGKRTFMNTVQGVHNMFESDNPNSIYIGRGLLPHLKRFIIDYDENDSLDVSYDIKRSFEINLLDKWKTRFENHPRGFGDYQLEDFNNLTRSQNGVVELFTGYGKTELMLSILESANVQTLILAPDLKVKQEIILRANDYGIDVRYEDWNHPFNVIVPTGFFRSQRYDQEFYEWTQSTQMILVDECHHLSNDSFQKSYVDCSIDLERSYGFTASLDVSKGKKFNSEVPPPEYGLELGKIIPKVGTVKSSRSLPVPVKINKITIDSGVKIKNYDENHYMELLDLTLLSKNFEDTLVRYLNYNEDRQFFIPIYKIETAKILHEKLISRGFKGMLYTSEGLIMSDGIKMNPDLKFLKDYCRENPYTYIMSTIFEGMDIPRLNGLIPFTGVNHRMNIQPLGRSARSKDVLVGLFFDESNSLWSSQSRARYTKLKKEFNVIEDKKFY